MHYLCFKIQVDFYSFVKVDINSQIRKICKAMWPVGGVKMVGTQFKIPKGNMHMTFEYQEYQVIMPTDWIQMWLHLEIIVVSFSYSMVKDIRLWQFWYVWNILYILNFLSYILRLPLPLLSPSFWITRKIHAVANSLLVLEGYLIKCESVFPLSCFFPILLLSGLKKLA